MKTDLRNVMVGLIVVSMGAGAYFAHPALRARVSHETRSLLGWTEAARQADPEGFTTHVEHRLKEDQVKLNSTRRELAIEVGNLIKKEKEQRNLLEYAEQFAVEFRGVYQQVGDSQTFPVSVRNADYNKEEVVSQVSLLLAEAEGYRQSIAKLNEVRQTAEERLEELTVRINSTEAQLASIATQRGLLRARVLSDEGEQLVAQVDELLNGNTVVIHGNPVRSVRELLIASEPVSERTPSMELARQFLTTKPAKPAAPAAEEVEVAAPNPGKNEAKPRVEVEVAAPKHRNSKPSVAEVDFETNVDFELKPNSGSAPIFQQN